MCLPLSVLVDLQKSGVCFNERIGAFLAYAPAWAEGHKADGHTNGRLRSWTLFCQRDYSVRILMSRNIY